MKTTETMYNGVSISPAMRRAAEDHLRGINSGFGTCAVTSTMAESWARKQKRLALEKLGSKCAACGETRTGVLRFDHIKPIRRKKVGGVTERGPSTVQTSRRIVLDRT